MSYSWLFVVFDRFYVILQGGGTSCTDVESVNFNTEGSNTASVVNSVGKFYFSFITQMSSENWTFSWSFAKNMLSLGSNKIFTVQVL